MPTAWWALQLGGSEAEMAMSLRTPRIPQVTPRPDTPHSPITPGSSSAVVVIDFTTYQLRGKARQLDQADGGRTMVEWCPDFLLLPSEQVHTYRQVAMASHPGCAHYETRPELLAALEPAFVLDPDDLATAQLLLANPKMSVFGPNDALHRPMRLEAQ
jgi:hypothetical protein